MKLLAALSVIVACCLVQVYCDCSASQVQTVQSQWQATFGSDQARLRQFAQQCYERSVALRVKLKNTFLKRHNKTKLG